MNKWMSLFTSSDNRQVDSYTASLGFPIPAPQVYRLHSILEPYLKLGAIQVQKPSNGLHHFVHEGNFRSTDYTATSPEV